MGVELVNLCHRYKDTIIASKNSSLILWFGWQAIAIDSNKSPQLKIHGVEDVNNHSTCRKLHHATATYRFVVGLLQISTSAPIFNK